MVVAAVEAKELVVSALFKNAAMVEYDDLVGIAHGGEPMGDDEGGTALHEAVHSLLYKTLGTGVDAGGGLVEDEYGRIGYRGTTDGQQLSLALREVASVAL